MIWSSCYNNSNNNTMDQQPQHQPQSQPQSHKQSNSPNHQQHHVPNDAIVNPQNNETKLSKKQIKKQQKKQKWDQLKKQKRREEKLKQKERKKQKQLLNPPQIKTDKPVQKKEPTKPRKQDYKQKMLDGQKVIIDLQFYQQMTEKQQNSLGKQLAYCHSINRKMAKPFNFILTSAQQKCMEFLHEKFNIKNYGINIIEANLLDTFNRDSLVYLTGDADEELQQFDSNQIYIIGGIVDHNRLKNITINYANQNKIKARRLPMEGLRLKASVHLAVNHVWEWMLRFYNGSTWREAIQAVIPERKLHDTEKDIKQDKAEIQEKGE